MTNHLIFVRQPICCWSQRAFELFGEMIETGDVDAISANYLLRVEICYGWNYSAHHDELAIQALAL